jgi:hypothetical protein
MKFYNVFSGNLSGKFREYYIKNLGDKKFNSLHSYWYFKSLTDDKILDAFSITKGSIMIDSGAFTAWSKNINIDVDEYINWINKWDKYVTLFGQIDVIPLPTMSKDEKAKCAKDTWDNFLYMYNRLNNPQKLLYTFHVGEPFEYLKQAMEFRDSQGRPLDYIALGGLVGKTTKIRDAFLTEAFNIIKTSSNPNVKVHGFGVSSEKMWRKYPFESCDSFTPGMNANHGFQCTEFGSYRSDDYNKIFKPRGRNPMEQAELDAIEQSKDDELLEEENNFRNDEKTKLLISNIEYWDNLANSINNQNYNVKKSLF